MAAAASLLQFVSTNSLVSQVDIAYTWDAGTATCSRYLPMHERGQSRFTMIQRALSHAAEAKAEGV